MHRHKLVSDDFKNTDHAFKTALLLVRVYHFVA